MIEGSDLIIITGDFSVSVEEEDPGPARVADKKSAGYRNLFLHRHQKVKSPLRAGGGIPAGVKEERYERRPVNLRIVSHGLSLKESSPN
jgi:hypothetical protein